MSNRFAVEFRDTEFPELVELGISFELDGKYTFQTVRCQGNNNTIMQAVQNGLAISLMQVDLVALAKRGEDNATISVQGS
jgi:hypothetical protein